MSAGNIKRETLKAIKRQKESGDVAEEINEQEVGGLLVALFSDFVKYVKQTNKPWVYIPNVVES